MPSPYTVQLVDGEDEADILTDLHRTTLPGSPIPDMDDGYWWLVYFERLIPPSPLTAPPETRQRVAGDR